MKEASVAAAPPKRRTYETPTLKKQMATKSTSKNWGHHRSGCQHHDATTPRPPVGAFAYGLQREDRRVQLARGRRFPEAGGRVEEGVLV